MKKENILVVALIVIALGGVYVFNALNRAPKAPINQAGAVKAQVTAGASGAILWQDYTPGMAQAKKDLKSVFLYFHAPWCTYCTKLKETTFKDSRVTSYLNDNFISIQVDTDQNRALAQEWRVKGLPTMWFLEPSGKKINSMPGYVEATQLLQILKYIHTQSYTTMEFHEFVKQG